MKLSRIGICVLAALLAMLALAATGEAHTLKIKRAAKANKTFTKLLCNAFKEDDEAECVASRPGPCRRVSEHRVRCKLFITLELEDGSRGRCLDQGDWFLRGRSGRLHAGAFKVVSCVTLRPPREEGEEEPAPGS